MQATKSSTNSRRSQLHLLPSLRSVRTSVHTTAGAGLSPARPEEQLGEGYRAESRQSCGTVDPCGHPDRLTTTHDRRDRGRQTSFLLRPFHAGRFTFPYPYKRQKMQEESGGFSTTCNRAPVMTSSANVQRKNPLRQLANAVLSGPFTASSTALGASKSGRSKLCVMSARQWC